MLSANLILIYPPPLCCNLSISIKISNAIPHDAVRYYGFLVTAEENIFSIWYVVTEVLVPLTGHLSPFHKCEAGMQNFTY